MDEKEKTVMQPSNAANVSKENETLAENGSPNASGNGASSRKKQKPERSGLLWELWEWVKIIIVAMVLAYLCNTYLIANSRIPTGSMQDTIMAGDHVIGSRLNYTFGAVERGDIAIFVYGYACKNCGITYREQENGVCPNCGQEDSKNQKVYYVKRVIGIPGDTIEIRQTGESDVSEFTEVPISSSSGKVPTGAVYVNGEKLEEDYLPEPMLVNAKFANGLDFPEFTGENAIVVPEGSYFVLGDNRNNSQDARFWGDAMFVKRDRMLAKVYLRYWPLNKIGLVE